MNKSYTVLPIKSVKSSLNPGSNWSHGIGVCVSPDGQRVIIGNTWYPEGNTAFTKGSCSLTREEAAAFADMIQKVVADHNAPITTVVTVDAKIPPGETEAKIPPIVQANTTPLPATNKRGPGRPLGAKDKAPRVRRAKLDDSARDAMLALGLSPAQIDASINSVHQNDVVEAFG